VTTSSSLRDTLQQSLGQTYRLEHELSGGGMSRVFVAQDVSLGREVVVKVLPPELAEGLSAERFTREVKVAARLQHANIVPVLAAGDAGGLPYYIMPYVRGQSLRDRLSRDGALPVGEVVAILRDVTRALAYAHDEGVVHRDIKPENVLVSGGAALVTDFGIAKAIAAATGGDRPESHQLTAIGVALGTPAYMAPEQALADPGADLRVDLYALGVLTWEMLVGRHMFGSRTPQALIAAHVAEAPEDIATRRPDVPLPLATLVMRLIAKRPDDRPASAADVLRLLDAVSTPTQTAASGAPVARESRARPRPLRVAALVAVPLVAIAVGAFWWRTRSTPHNVSDNAIAIAPFRVTGADASLAYLREGMVDLLAAKIDGIGGLRAVDPRTTLVTWRRAAGSDGDLAIDDALRVARDVGARRLILGEIAGTSASLMLSVTLLPGAVGRESPRAVETGPADSLPALVDRVVARLMSLGAGEATPRLAELTSTSLPALRAYLEARARYRSSATIPAMQAFFRAVEIDSNFTLAALGLVRTVGWGGQSAADRARATAVGGRILHRGRHRLSPADAALADAALGPRYPVPKTYAEWFAATERLTTLAPENPEGWFDLGDVLFHSGGVLGIPDADQRAIRAFSHVLALDSAFTLPFVHLASLYSELGDTAGARRLFAMRARVDPLAQSTSALHVALLLGDSASARSFRAGMERMQRLPLASLVRSALFNHYGLDDAQRALDLLAPEAITGDTRTSHTSLAFAVATERGRPQEAEVVAKGSLATPSIAREVALTAVFAGGDSALGAAAARTLEPVVDAALKTALAGVPFSSEGAAPATALSDHVDAPLVLAQYRLAMGDASVAKHVIPWLRGYVPPKDSAWLREFPLARALLLDAQVAALDRRADAPVALAQLDSAARFGHHDPRFTAVSSLVAGRLWEDRGDVARALAALRRRLRGIGANYYESTWQRELGRLAALAGEREAAIRAYRIYLIRRANPEPALAAEVAHVRAELARLERASAGR
jgi:serine/threonine protein kinase